MERMTRLARLTRLPTLRHTHTEHRNPPQENFYRFAVVPFEPQ